MSMNFDISDITFISDIVDKYKYMVYSTIYRISEKLDVISRVCWKLKMEYFFLINPFLTFSTP